MHIYTLNLEKLCGAEKNFVGLLPYIFYYVTFVPIVTYWMVSSSSLSWATTPGSIIWIAIFVFNALGIFFAWQKDLFKTWVCWTLMTIASGLSFAYLVGITYTALSLSALGLLQFFKDYWREILVPLVFSLLYLTFGLVTIINGYHKKIKTTG